MTDLSTAFRTWWDSTATTDQRDQVTAIAKDGDQPLPADLVRAMAESGVLLVGSRFENSGAGFDFYLTPDMYDTVLAED